MATVTKSAVDELQEDIQLLKKQSVPYVVYEKTMARFERTIKRLIYVIVLLIIILGAMIYEWTQWDYSDVVVDSTGGGQAAYMGDGASGVINNGEGYSPQEDAQEP